MARPDYPERLDIELTNDCQLHCIMCPRGIGKMNRPVGYMDEALFSKVITESAGKVKRVWAHVFGEPLLYPDLIWALTELRAVGFWVGISTNCVALDKPMSEAIIRTGIDCLILSLDSLNKDKYETIRRGADFRRTLANIDACIDVRRQIPESKTELIIQIIDMKDAEKEIETARERFGKNLEGIGQVFHKWYSTYGGKVPGYGGNIISPTNGICESLDQTLAILWNGDVTICCHDVAGDYVFGNVRNSTLSELWNSASCRVMHEEIRNRTFAGLEMCRNCIG
jgi:radical SAM protein with 4Fe4S-binding SPASM domain